MVTEILSTAVANTTASTTATQNGLDIGDYTGIVTLLATAITFALTYCHGSHVVRADSIEKLCINLHLNERFIKNSNLNCAY